MLQRFIGLLKCACLAFALLSLTLATGCGDNATIEENVIVEEGAEESPEAMMEEPDGPAQGGDDEGGDDEGGGDEGGSDEDGGDEGDDSE